MQIMAVVHAVVTRVIKSVVSQITGLGAALLIYQGISIVFMCLEPRCSNLALEMNLTCLQMSKCKGTCPCRARLAAVYLAAGAGAVAGAVAGAPAEELKWTAAKQSMQAAESWRCWASSRGSTA